MTQTTRRTALGAVAALGAYLLTTANKASAATVNDTYQPSQFTAEAIGATSDGWVDHTGPTWDDNSVAHNHRDTENRENTLHRHHRDGIDAMFAALAPATRTLKIMCVGDSITMGLGSTSAGGTYPAFNLGGGPGYQPWLASSLLRRRVKADIVTVAQGGQGLRTMTPVTLSALASEKPDFVLIHLGTNDSSDLVDYTPRWGTLIDGILSGSSAKVAVALLPSYRPDWLNNAVPAMNKSITDAVNARKGTGRVALADTSGLTPNWTGDGIHPLEAGYVYIAQAFTTAIAGLGG